MQNRILLIYIQEANIPLDVLKFLILLADIKPKIRRKIEILH